MFISQCLVVLMFIWAFSGARHLDLLDPSLTRQRETRTNFLLAFVLGPGAWIALITGSILQSFMKEAPRAQPLLGTEVIKPLPQKARHEMSLEELAFLFGGEVIETHQILFDRVGRSVGREDRPRYRPVEVTRAARQDGENK